VTVDIELRDKKYPVEFLLNCGGTHVAWQRIAADTAAATAAPLPMTAARAVPS